MESQQTSAPQSINPTDSAIPFVREIHKSETDLLRTAFHWDALFPRFYQNSGDTFRSDRGEEAAVEFFRSCAKLYGAFNETGELKALVYFEAKNWNRGETADMIAHLSTSRRAPLTSEQMASALCQIRDDCFRQGTRRISTFILKQNRGLADLCRSIGFEPTGLTMRHGRSHGKVLEWIQLGMTRA